MEKIRAAHFEQLRSIAPDVAIELYLDNNNSKDI